MGGYNFPRLNLRQVLENTSEHACRFYAVVLDPDTGKRLATIPFYELVSGEMVDFSIERETLFPKEKGGIK